MFLDLWREFSGSMDRLENGQVGDSSFALSCRLLRKRLANACAANIFTGVRYLDGRPFDSSSLGLVPRSTAKVVPRNIGWVSGIQDWDDRWNVSEFRLSERCGLRFATWIPGGFQSSFDVDQLGSRTGF